MRSNPNLQGHRAPPGQNAHAKRMIEGTDAPNARQEDGGKKGERQMRPGRSPPDVLRRICDDEMTI
eukprot:8308409-Pyramimonas_sp.AAC.1